MAISKHTEFSFADNTVLRNGGVFLAFNNGELWLKNPEPTDLNNMLMLANEMGARVRGDEFETYESVNKTFVHPDDVELISSAQQEFKELKRSAKNRTYLLNAKIFSFFVLLILVFYTLGWLE
ncbi:MAG: hypothetical protein KAT90_13075 [Gammaproteobacteria bacterium]|nr:hypothetical protein [Gammaproteobacteria bacterium]